MRPLIASIAAALLFGAGLVHAQPSAGSDYRVLDEPQPTSGEGVQVIEFFSYACPHCFDFRPKLHEWEQNIEQDFELTRIPVNFGRESWERLAVGFYAADTLGALDKTHKATYEALHIQGRQFRSNGALADFYAEQGLDRQEVMDAFDSFAVNMKVKRGKRMVRDYQVRSTPSVVIAGRYVVSPSTAGSQDKMIEVMDYLVEKAASE